ncbi:MAG: FAD-dependent oxidoreductase [Candidatus Aminicenantes bacterium]
MDSRPVSISILGGGPAGLALGFYAKKSGIPFVIYEASSRLGGISVTLKHGDFLYDSGAHRLHDKDEEVMLDLKEILGEELKHIDMPSQIYDHGQFIDFPLSPLNLMRNLGLLTFFKAGLEVLTGKFRSRGPQRNFAEFAVNTYGKTVAEKFLMNYSEKLWGLPSDGLSVGIAAKRMKGLDLKTFLMEAFLGSKVKTRHLDGAFYYPDRGIGEISQALAEYCGEENIAKNAKVTKIVHDHQKIQAIEINDREMRETDFVISTLPIDHVVRMMEPPLPEKALSSANHFKYRNVVLVALFLRRASVTEAATIYFPDPEIPFTRIYEPKNRSPYMSPPERTSLVAELPCNPDHKLWGLEDKELIQMVSPRLIQMEWIKAEDIIGTSVYRIDHAYPTLELGFEENLKTLSAYLAPFKNIKISGRNGRFYAVHIHDVMRWGKDIIAEFVSEEGKSWS